MTQTESPPLAGNDERGQLLYRRLQDWRIRLFDSYNQLSTDYLRAVRNDLAAAIAVIDEELTARADPPAPE